MYCVNFRPRLDSPFLPFDPPSGDGQANLMSGFMDGPARRPSVLGGGRDLARPLKPLPGWACGKGHQSAKGGARPPAAAPGWTPEGRRGAQLRPGATRTRAGHNGPIRVSTMVRYAHSTERYTHLANDGLGELVEARRNAQLRGGGG